MGSSYSTELVKEAPASWATYCTKEWRSERAGELDRLGGAMHLSANVLVRLDVWTHTSLLTHDRRAEPSSNQTWRQLQCKTAVLVGKQLKIPQRPERAFGASCSKFDLALY